MTDTYLQKSVGELHIGSAPVLSVLESDSALATFGKLDDTGRSGLAVVDGSGHIVANTSSSDIKACVSFPFSNFVLVSFRSFFPCRYNPFLLSLM